MSRGADAAEVAQTSPRQSGPLEAIAAFGPAGFVAQQQVTAEAMIAASQKLVEGFQEVITRSIQLQIALNQQILSGALRVPSFGRASGNDETGEAAFTAISDATVAAVHDVIAAACKCSADALMTFHDRIEQNPGIHASVDPACRRPDVDRRQAS